MKPGKNKFLRCSVLYLNLINIIQTYTITLVDTKIVQHKDSVESVAIPGSTIFFLPQLLYFETNFLWSKKAHK